MLLERFKKKKSKSNNSEYSSDNFYSLDDIPDKEYQVSDLYIAYPALITKGKDKDGFDTLVYNGQEALEKIVVRYEKNSKSYVINVLNSRRYGIFSSFCYSGLLPFLGQYMINDLAPLEFYLENKTKTTITTEEICYFLYPNLKKKETSSEYKDAVLKQIKETNEKINSSSLSEESKDELKKSLISLAHYYVNTLKELSVKKNNHSLNLDTNKKSVIDLRQECMKKLVEIEIMLPPENINNLALELETLEEEIKRKVL